MPFKTRYLTSKRRRFVTLSFFCANVWKKFTQKFIHLGGRNFSYFCSCFSFCLKKLCQQSNVSFRFLQCVLVFLFFNKRLINGAFQRSKPSTSHIGFKSRSKTRGPRLCTSEVCDWAKVYRSRFLLANRFNVVVLRELFFECVKSQYLGYFLTCQRVIVS